MILFKKNFFYINKKIVYANNPYKIEFVDFIKPGKGKPFIRTKLRNLITKKLISKTFKFIENNVSSANIVSTEYFFIFKQRDRWCFLNTKTLHQIYLDTVIIGNNNSKWLSVNNKYKILFWNNKPIDILIPNYIILKVVDTSLNYQGNVVNNTKYAVLNTGLCVKVPLFIKKGFFIKIDVRNNRYISKI